jgi:hypothetical protein
MGQSKAGKGLGYAYMCGVDYALCKGYHTPTNAGLRSRANKVHNSPEEAFKCHALFLMSRGFTKISSREFKDPETGYIRVLTKQSRFGGKLRSGKERTRFMTLDVNGTKAGLVASY